jgi:hypothetical protein
LAVPTQINGSTADKVMAASVLGISVIWLILKIGWEFMEIMVLEAQGI